MKTFWKEYNEVLREFHLAMAAVYQCSTLSASQIEQVSDNLVRDLTKNLKTIRTAHEHKGLPKYIFRKIIVS